MDTTINLRIDVDLKIALEELAFENELSLSQYLREQLQEHVDQTYYEDEFDFTDAKIFINNIVRYEYEQSFDFTHLLTWLFYKQSVPTETNSDEVINAIKNKVARVINESSFSEELKLEFSKVLNDMNRFLHETNDENKKFNFQYPNNPYSFDYIILINEIWSINP